MSHWAAPRDSDLCSIAVGSGQRLDINLDILFWWLAGKPECPEEANSGAGSVSPPWELNPRPFCCRATALNCLSLLFFFSMSRQECWNALGTFKLPVCFFYRTHTRTHTDKSYVCWNTKSTSAHAEDTGFSWRIVTAASSHTWVRCQCQVQSIESQKKLQNK